MTVTVHSTAIVHESASLGDGTTVWHWVHIREHAQIGPNTIIGQSVYIAPHSVIGSNVKIQNSVNIFQPCHIANGVFIGPGVVFTNDRNPRAVNLDLQMKQDSDWEPQSISIDSGASIGAGAICISPLRIGRWAMIAAGAVVTRDVPPFALMVGIPASRVAWVGRAGLKLVQISTNEFMCPISGERYLQTAEEVLCEAGAS